jgi:DNA-binding CsgD family transcriptional regulator
MSGGSTITSRETALLADIVEACRQPSDLPMPGRVLELVQELLHAETVTFVGLDSKLPRIRFLQAVNSGGVHECESESLAQARSNIFWRRYWDPDKGCSYADMTGDDTFVRRSSECESLRQRRAWYDPETGEFAERLIQACLPFESLGRYSRVTGFRDGSDFTEKDVLFLKLLQPHFQQAYAANAATRRSTPPLTGRQMQVMRMVQAGLSNRQIARRAGVSEGTVHNHLTNVYGRLGVQSRTAAVHAVFDTAEDWSPHGDAAGLLARP